MAPSSRLLHGLLDDVRRSDVLRWLVPLALGCASVPQFVPREPVSDALATEVHMWSEAESAALLRTVPPASGWMDTSNCGGCRELVSVDRRIARVGEFVLVGGSERVRSVDLASLRIVDAIAIRPEDVHAPDRDSASATQRALIAESTGVWVVDAGALSFVEVDAEGRLALRERHLLPAERSPCSRDLPFAYDGRRVSFAFGVMLNGEVPTWASEGHTLTSTTRVVGFDPSFAEWPRIRYPGLGTGEATLVVRCDLTTRHCEQELFPLAQVAFSGSDTWIVHSDLLVRRHEDGRFVARRASGVIRDWRVGERHVDLRVEGGVERWSSDLARVSHLRSRHRVLLGPGFLLVDRHDDTLVVRDDGTHARWNGGTRRLYVHGDRSWRSGPEGFHRIDRLVSTFVAPDPVGFVAAGSEGVIFRGGAQLFVVRDDDVRTSEEAGLSGFFVDGRAYGIGERHVAALDGDER
jgi:hypothetical protein